MRLLRDPNRFKKLKDGWIRDSLLGVEWGPSSDEIMNFESAQKYCSEQGGRLPEVNELHTLANYSQKKPAIDTAFFKDTKTNDWYWTGTEVAGVSSCAWCVDFDDGFVDFFGKDGTFCVRPVRSSQ